MVNGSLNEQWKTIDDHPNYEVSSEGRIRSIGRWLINQNGIKRYWKVRLLTSHPGGSGYRSIVLDGEGCWVHKLVAVAFIPNPQNKRCVNHKDKNKTNNSISNLEWVTHQENMDHLVRTRAPDALMAMMKLTDQQVEEIVQEHFGTRTDQSIAKLYHVGRETIARLRRAQGILPVVARKNDQLNFATASEIRELYKLGESVSVLSSKYKVTPGLIRNVISYRTWRDKPCKKAIEI